MTAKIPDPPIGEVLSVFDPRWSVPPPPDDMNRALQIYHPEHGWLTFLLPEAEAQCLAAWLIRPRS